MQGFRGFRELWLESYIKKTNPLTIKMVYYSQLIRQDKDNDERGPMIVNDSTIIEYRWDEGSKTWQGQYSKSKISKPQILSYYLGDNDLLFTNSYYTFLKTALLSKAKRKLTLAYLNKIKNVYGL